MNRPALAPNPVALAHQALMAPHGGGPNDLYLPRAAAEDLERRSAELPAIALSTRQLCDLELLLRGALAPLDGFLGRADYNRVVEDMRLADGSLWPMPVTLDVSEAFSAQLSHGSEVALRDNRGVALAVLEVHDIYWPDRLHEARRVFGITNRSHPGVAELLERTQPVYLGGRVRGIQPPAQQRVAQLRDTPRQSPDWFAEQGRRRIVAAKHERPMAHGVSLDEPCAGETARTCWASP